MRIIMLFLNEEIAIITTIKMLLMIIFFSSFISLLSMCLIIYPLKKLHKKIGTKNFLISLISLTITGSLFLAPATAVTLFIFLIAFVAIPVISKNKYIVFALLAVYFFIISDMMLPALGTARESSRRISCGSNLKQIGTTMFMYAGDNNGHFPDKDGEGGFEMLRAHNYLSDYAIYLCPSTMDMEPETGSVKSSYIYHGGLTTSSPPETILAEDKKNNHLGYKNYLYCNGTVKGVKDPNYHDYKNSPIIYSLIRLFQ